jgi:preprotein translocase subunit SecD
MNPKRLFTIILCLTLIAGVIDMPVELPINIHWRMINVDTIIRRPKFDFTLFGAHITQNFDIKQGLDLQGGTRVVLKADMSTIAQADRTTALESARNVIARRVDLFGVSEPVIQTSIVGEEYRISVELPGVKDINEALNLIGRTAQLDFRELAPTATQAAFLSDFIQTGLTGKNLKKSAVQFNSQNGEPEVALVFDEEGAKQFSDITGRNIGKQVAIFLDDMLVTYPRVNTQITGGEAVISGQFTFEDAKNLSIQLNAGALPVPIEILEQKDVDASLGQESINRSLRAGAIGLGMVMVFMVLLYGAQGVIADIALVVYGLITLALYKLIPVTITLPGLAGFILSIGMAVDSNILIFERMKEEIRMGKPWSTAMELGFGRAWDSIKDANVASLITSFILFNPLDWSFLNSSGMVRGFALTLGLGIITGLFTGIVVTRTLMRLFYRPSKKMQAVLPNSKKKVDK